jgi:cytochrome P450
MRTNTPAAEARARASGIPVVDFDIELDPQFREDPSKRFSEAIEVGPIFYSSAARGFWVVSKYDLIVEIVHHPEQFSSREVFNFYREEFDFRDIPTQLDPPDHIPIRRLIQPYLAPAAIRALEPSIREVARKLIDELSMRSECKFNEDFGERLPAIVIMKQLGLPLEREREIVELNLRVEYPDSVSDPGYRKQKEAAYTLEAMWGQVIQERRARPLDDWTSQIIRSELEGRPLDSDTLLGLLSILLRGGLETTAGTLGFSMHHLATHSEDRERLVNDPSLIPSAVEELLRCYGGSPIIARIVSADLDFHGVPMREGDRLVLLLWSANRDLAAFEHADRVDFGRNPNKHLGFGLGVHRCPGMHLARTELRIALEEWHERIPDYHLGDMSGVKHQLSQDVRLTALPLIFDRVRNLAGRPVSPHESGSQA